MKVGLNLPVTVPHITAADLRRLACEAEACGFAELYLGEHVVLFDQTTDLYPATEGDVTFPATAALPDPLVGLAYFAACTTSIRLATGILLLPQRNPVYTAKQIATLDWLCGGRFDCALGLGWSQQEFAACGVPWEERGARADEYIQLMRCLWADGISEFHGRFYDLPACRQYPKPAQAPHPPLWIGGWTDAALGRAARVGDGWYGFGLAPDQAATCIDRLSRRTEEAGRDPGRLQIVVGLYSELPLDGGKLDAYEQAGVQQLVLSFTELTPDGLLRQLEHYTEWMRGRGAAG